MPPLSENTPRDYQIGEKEDYPVEAAAKIFEGAAVGENAAGFSRPLVALDPFQGFAEEEADNAGGLAGDIRVRVKSKGRIVLDVATAAITSNDRPAVYAAADDTFTLVAAGSTKIGYVSRFISGTTCVVEFDARGI